MPFPEPSQPLLIHPVSSVTVTSHSLPQEGLCASVGRARTRLG